MLLSCGRLMAALSRFVNRVGRGSVGRPATTTRVASGLLTETRIGRPAVKRGGSVRRPATTAASRRAGRAAATAVAGWVEGLEQRIVPATVTVNSLADSVAANDGQYTLREALEAVTNGRTFPGDNNATGQISGAFGSNDTIQFASSLFANAQTQTMTLSLGEFLLLQNVKIVGPGADLLAISGDNQSRVFHVLSEVTATISGLTISDGVALSIGGFAGIPRDANLNPILPEGFGLGGAIRNHGALTMRDVKITECSAVEGGGIFNAGSMLLTQCTIESNVGTSGRAT